ncbi:unnamed protein product [Sphagnum balticum]
MLRYFMRQRADSRSPCNFSSVSFLCVCVLELVSLRLREFVNRARSGGRRRRSCGFFFFAKPFVYHGDARTRPYGRTLEHSLLR